MKAYKLATLFFIIVVLICYQGSSTLGKETVPENTFENQTEFEEDNIYVEKDLDASISQADETERQTEEDLPEEEMSSETEQLDVIETAGFNLYEGETLNSQMHLGTYTTWAQLIQKIKDTGPNVYAIDIRDMILQPNNANWSSQLTDGTEQYFLHFYSTTYNGTPESGSVTFSETTYMGAHVRFHSGVGLNVPTSAGAGQRPFNANSLNTLAEYNNLNSGVIFANGWRFIVDKEVDVKGYAQLYASGIATFDFTTGKTVLEENGEQINAGYIEVNSGQWRSLVGYRAGAIGAYRVKVGTNDDPKNPVRVDAIFGSNVRGGRMSPVTPHPDIPTEYLEVGGNTIITYGVAMMTTGETSYNNGVSDFTKIYTTQKIKISGNVSILSTFSAMTAASLQNLGTDNRSQYNRISVSASSIWDGYYHYTNYNAVVNMIIEISDNVYIAGDVIGNGPNMYFNVHNESKGVHISIKDRAQIGGNIVYGGSSHAINVKPNDSPDNPFFTIDIKGSSEGDGVKIGGSVLATNGEDRSTASSWYASTKIVNAKVNGSVFGYGNLANQFAYTGISIQGAEVVVQGSEVGGGVYGVATGSGENNNSNQGSAKKCTIKIENSKVGHVVPFFTLKTRESNNTGNTNNYPIGEAEIKIDNSIITGRTVLWLSRYDYQEARNLSVYSFVADDSSGVTDSDLKPFADITIDEYGNRTIQFNTDNYIGIPLDQGRPDISLTTSMEQLADKGMRLANLTIGLDVSRKDEFPGNHKVSITNTNFTRENGNPIINIMDTGDGTLGTKAEIIIDNCHATAPGKKLDVAVFGNLIDNVTSSKIEEMRIEVRNTNDIENVGFVNSDSDYYINTKAKIILENTVTKALFGKKGTENKPIRNPHSPGMNPDDRVEFIFHGYNTVEEVWANGADIVFGRNMEEEPVKDSVSYISKRFNNTGGLSGSEVWGDEWIDVQEGARVYLGNEGTAADAESIGQAQTYRIFGSIRGSDGEIYIYKDTNDMESFPNKTYPIYVASEGRIINEGMNLGEWTADGGYITTINENAELDGSDEPVEFTIIEPEVSKNNLNIQQEHDVLMVFEDAEDAKPEMLNDIPLRPWPIIRHETQKGWLILGKPRYQVAYRGTGYLEETTEEVIGQVRLGEEQNDFIWSPSADDYWYLEDPDIYTIESVIPIPENPGYEFMYWKLFSATEREDDNSIIIRNDWIPGTGVANNSPPTEDKMPGIVLPEDGNVWIAGDQFSLLELLRTQKVPKTESKVMMLVPIYKANYTCKIGEKGYFTLSDAFTAIDNEIAFQKEDGSYLIEMLVEEYEVNSSFIVKDGKVITITTASPDDQTLPYLGAEGTNCMLKRDYIDEHKTLPYKGEFFSIKGVGGKLIVSNLTLDGNKEQIASDHAVIKLDNSASLSLLPGSIIRNNKSTSLGAAIQGSGDNSLLLESVIITGNVSVQSGGGGIIPGETSDIALKGKPVITDNSTVLEEEQSPANICLEKDGKVKIQGSLLTGSIIGVRVDPADHIDKYILAEAEDDEGAKESAGYFMDDYSDQLIIVINPDNPLQLQFFHGVKFTFIKVRAENTASALDGAEFKLYQLECEDLNHDHMIETDIVDEKSILEECWKEVSSDVSGGDGKAAGLVEMGNLAKGTYMLAETNAAQGYQLPQGQWLIKIEPQQQDKITITARGPGHNMVPAFMTATDGDGTPIYKLPNIKLLQLPLTGMPGIYKFLIVGGVILFITTLLFFLHKWRNNKPVSL